jgi:hypothetical protein
MTEGCETCNNIMNNGQQKPVPDSPRKESGLSSPVQNPFAMVPNDRKDLDRLLNDLAEDPDSENEEVCLEKRVFYRVISGEFCSLTLVGRPLLPYSHISTNKGLHSSISIHICDEYFNQTTGEWVCESIFNRSLCLL